MSLLQTVRLSVGWAKQSRACFLLLEKQLLDIKESMQNFPAITMLNNQLYFGFPSPIVK